MQRLIPLLEGRRHPSGWIERGMMTLLGTLGEGYGLIQAGRGYAYQRGYLTPWRADCPVIAVGNLTAGGTGKTPMVAWLGHYFLDRGIPLAIVSRGYRQRSASPITVVADGTRRILDAPEAADEAVLLAHELPGAVIVTGANRRRLIQYATQQLGCKLVIMDDGFQHLQIHRDWNLLLLDAQRPWGNGRILPGGTLRESLKAMGRADGILFTRAHVGIDLTVAQETIRGTVPAMPMAQCRHQPLHWIDAATGERFPLDTLRHQKIMAFCGIANPESFRSTLTDLSIIPVDFKAFPDHHVITHAEMTQLETQARNHPVDFLVTTQKDWVKIPPNATTLPLFVLAIGMQFSSVPPWLTERLESLVAASSSGSPRERRAG
ncbi:MAG: tetraacyldisaccharide 4'-kinase [Nitrospirae bacterium]|nr:tetraacyldisaccharide 4'-kinase [Magnetococcales bacterium]HAT49039.1 tetraacyldisaccharide 4'-kinase [Alphaproteobacteria bacterium]